MYKIRAILDTEEDVIRTILVDNTINLESLHTIIANSFGFEGHEMASFYRADEDWNQGKKSRYSTWLRLVRIFQWKIVF